MQGLQSSYGVRFNKIAGSIKKDSGLKQQSGLKKVSTGFAQMIMPVETEHQGLVSPMPAPQVLDRPEPNDPNYESCRH